MQGDVVDGDDGTSVLWGCSIDNVPYPPRGGLPLPLQVMPSMKPLKIEHELVLTSMCSRVIPLSEMHGMYLMCTRICA